MSYHEIALDLMRGLAVLAILLNHIEFMLGEFSIGIHQAYLAVDFLFVLSGFVICTGYNCAAKPDLTSPTLLIQRIGRF